MFHYCKHFALKNIPEFQVLDYVLCPGEFLFYLFHFMVLFFTEITLHVYVPVKETGLDKH